MIPGPQLTLNLLQKKNTEPFIECLYRLNNYHWTHAFIKYHAYKGWSKFKGAVSENRCMDIRYSLQDDNDGNKSHSPKLLGYIILLSIQFQVALY